MFVMRNGRRYFALFILCITYIVLAESAYRDDEEVVTTTVASSTVVSQTDDNITLSDVISSNTSHHGLEEGSTVPSVQPTVTPTTHSPPHSSSEEGEANERAPSPSETLKSLSSEITDLLKKPMDFSYLIPFTEGVQLTLADNPIDLSAFTIDKTIMFKLDEMLHGRDLSEFLYVACRLAGIEARQARMKNKTLTSLPLEDLFDQSEENDIILRSEDVDELVGEITEDPSILDLDQTAGIPTPRRAKRKAKAHSSFRWPATIPYIISTDFKYDANSRRVIAAGIKHWQDETCLRFNKFTSYRGPHIIFKKGSGCTSSVGRINRINGQEISIGTGCDKKGIVAHEIGHAIGFRHEHQRPDRDLYVNIHLENIKTGYERYFWKRKWDELFTMGIPYDYSSVMHYPLYYFSRNTLNTLTAKDTEMNPVVGQRIGLSFYDVKLANFMYCKDKCTQGLVWSACKNDGYRDPKDCRRCKCPDGWTGHYCTAVKSGVRANCGTNSLTASSAWQTLKSPNYDTSSYPANSECTWHIKANGKYTIRLKFTGAFGFHCASNGRGPCVDFIEVRYKDMAKAGPRFCCSKRPTKELVSHGNEMLVLLRTTSGYRYKGFSLQYRQETCGGCYAAVSIQSAPACLDTQTYACNGRYSECNGGRCVTKYRHNTCYIEKKSCCGGFRLTGSNCYHQTGQWSSWSGWSSCSRSCNSGYRSRRRSCLRQPCSGPTTSYINCPGTCGYWSG